MAPKRTIDWFAGHAQWRSYNDGNAPATRLIQMVPYESLIPSVIKTHFNAVTDGHGGHDGSMWRGTSTNPWRWEHIVHPVHLVVQGHNSLFTGEYVPLGQSACWVFDCRTGSSINPRKRTGVEEALRVVSPESDKMIWELLTFLSTVQDMHHPTCWRWCPRRFHWCSPKEPCRTGLKYGNI